MIFQFFGSLVSKKPMGTPQKFWKIYTFSDPILKGGGLSVSGGLSVWNSPDGGQSYLTETF